MKIKWLGHASFLITSDSGVKIVTDPYTPDNQLSYKPIDETADIVTVSHDHFDHNNARAVKGNPVVLKQSREVKGIYFKAVPAYHDKASGKQRGPDTVFCFSVDGVNICHMGDLGQIPDDRQITEMGRVDVLLIPAGGFFTLEPDEINKVVDTVKPKIVIPMHYKTEKTGLPFSGVDKFIKNKTNVDKQDSSEIAVGPSTLPKSTKIVVLKPAN